MARKHVAKHLKKLDSHHLKFRKEIFKHLKKLARHKGCYSDYPQASRKRKAKGFSDHMGGLRQGSIYDQMAAYKPRKKKTQAQVDKESDAMAAAMFKRQDKEQLRRQAQAKLPKSTNANAINMFRHKGQRKTWDDSKLHDRVIKAAQKAKVASLGGSGQLLGGSGQLLGGSGRFARGRKPHKKRKYKKRKLPVWVKRPVKKGKTYPKAPAGFSKEAKGFWDSVKSGAAAIGNSLGKHADTIKKIGSAMGKTALQLGTQYISGKIQQGQQMAQQQLDMAQQRASSYANQVQNQVQGYVQQGLQQGQQMAQGYAQQGRAMAQGYVDQGGRMVQQGMQQAQQAIYDEFGRVIGYR